MNTLFLLFAEFETSNIPLENVAKKYFAHEKAKMQRLARLQQYPFPVFRGGTQKSEWLVSAVDLASYVDTLRSNAQVEHELMKKAS